MVARTIGDLFDDRVGRHPGREALISSPDHGRYSYGELREAVDLCARGLLACGLRPLDRVAVWAPALAERIIVQLSLAKIGAALVCLDPAQDSAAASVILKQSHASVLILASSLQGIEDHVLLGQVCPEARTSPRGQIRCARLPTLHTVVSLGTKRPNGAYHWGDLLALGGGVRTAMLRERQLEVDPGDPVALLYNTPPRRVPTGSHEDLLAAAAALATAFALREHDRLCVAVPATHGRGLEAASLACLAEGATIVLPPPELDPGSLLRTVQEERCTALYAPPLMVNALLTARAIGQYDLSTLRTEEHAVERRSPIT